MILLQCMVHFLRTIKSDLNRFKNITWVSFLRRFDGVNLFKLNRFCHFLSFNFDKHLKVGIKSGIYYFWYVVNLYQFKASALQIWGKNKQSLSITVKWQLHVLEKKKKCSGSRIRTRDIYFNFLMASQAKL